MFNLLAWLFDIICVAIGWIFPNNMTDWFE